MKKESELQHEFVDLTTSVHYTLPEDVLQKLSKYVVDESRGNPFVNYEKKINNLNFNKTSEGEKAKKEEFISPKIAAILREVMRELRGFAITVGGVIQRVGSKILDFIFDAIKMFPHTACGLLIIAMLSFISSHIPVIGHFLNALLVPLDVVVVAITFAQDVLGGSEAFSKIFSAFAKPYIVWGQNLMSCLQSETAFNNYYVKNSYVSKSLKAGLVGLSAGGGAISTAAVVGGTTGIAGVAAHAVAWPIVGGIASGIVSGAVATAIFKILPIAIGIALFFTLLFFFIFRKKKVEIQAETGIDSLADVVGNIVFLPMLAKCNKILEKEKNKEYLSNARKFSTEKICDWGYTKEFADELVAKNLMTKSSEKLLKEFNEELTKIEKLKKKESYKGISKVELPPKALKKISALLANQIG